LWTPTAALPVGASHPFYQRYVETICEDFGAGEVARPGLSQGIYFRVLMVGYFEGIDSKRDSHGAPAIVCRFERSYGSHWTKACRIIRPSHEPGA